jgi:Concanavalin A-like lectin/glucanases superfamily
VARTRTLGAGIVVALLLVAACAVVQWGPWHGPIILALSAAHGIHLGDLLALPFFVLAFAIGRSRAQERPRGARWHGRWALPASAVVLGVLLLLAAVEGTSKEPLLPAGGGTFDGGTPEHADGRRADPVKHWSHLAVSYDGTALRLYVNGAQVSRRATSGTILRTTDPLWIGGNQPYGEYFRGLIDEVRVYDRALGPAEVRAEMSAPIAGVGTSPAAGLVGAYAFDRGTGTVAADASGNGNAGAIAGATWATRGRFGGALRFDGDDDVVRIASSASLDLRRAMTLSAWSRPSESQDGWRTILHRQTDAYFLTAGGGGTYQALGALDDARAALLVAAAVWFCLMLAARPTDRVAPRRRSWWAPVALFLAGSLVDAALAPSATLIGPTLVALWVARTAPHRGEAGTMYLLAAVFTAVTVVSVAGAGSAEVARDYGGIARSIALGLLLVTAGVLDSVRARMTAYPRPEVRWPTTP